VRGVDGGVEVPPFRILIARYVLGKVRGCYFEADTVSHLLNGGRGCRRL